MSARLTLGPVFGIGHWWNVKQTKKKEALLQVRCFYFENKPKLITVSFCSLYFFCSIVIVLKIKV